MKILKAEESKGYFLTKNGGYETVDKMDKDALYYLVELALEGDDECELDPYDEELLPNQGHQIIYKNLHEKLAELVNKKNGFLDQSQRLYLEEYKRYKADLEQNNNDAEAEPEESSQ